MIKYIYIVTSHVICRIDQRISHVLHSLSGGEHLTTPDLNICNASGRSITLIHKTWVAQQITRDGRYGMVLAYHVNTQSQLCLLSPTSTDYSR